MEGRTIAGKDRGVAPSLRASSSQTETKTPCFLSFENLKGSSPFHAYLTPPAIAAWLVALDAICIGSPWRGNRRPPRVMPAKNIATTVKTIMASFRGGLSPRICLSKSSQSRCSISKSPLPGICIGEREKKSSGSLHSPFIEGYLPAICGTAALYCGTAVPSDRVSSDPGESEHSTREVFTSARGKVVANASLAQQSRPRFFG